MYFRILLTLVVSPDETSTAGSDPLQVWEASRFFPQRAEQGNKCRSFRLLVDLRTANPLPVVPRFSSEGSRGYPSACSSCVPHNAAMPRFDEWRQGHSVGSTKIASALPLIWSLFRVRMNRWVAEVPPAEMGCSVMGHKRADAALIVMSDCFKVVTGSWRGTTPAQSEVW